MLNLFDIDNIKIADIWFMIFIKHNRVDSSEHFNVSMTLKIKVPQVNICYVYFQSSLTYVGYLHNWENMFMLKVFKRMMYEVPAKY